MGLWTVALAAFVIIGADLMWAVALGDLIRRDGAVPAGVPFASAPQIDWPNPAVLAQLLLSVVHGLGWWALPALQVVLVAATLLVVLADASRMGAHPGRSAAVVSLVVIGCASAFVLVRFPSLSLVPFVVLVLLLRRQEERPGRAVWLVPPLRHRVGQPARWRARGAGGARGVGAGGSFAHVRPAGAGRGRVPVRAGAHVGRAAHPGVLPRRPRQRGGGPSHGDVGGARPDQPARRRHGAVRRGPARPRGAVAGALGVGRRRGASRWPPSPPPATGSGCCCSWRRSQQPGATAGPRRLRMAPRRRAGAAASGRAPGRRGR